MTGIAQGVVSPTVETPPHASPSMARRVVGGVLLLVPLLAIWVALPLYVDSFLAKYGVGLGLPNSVVLVVGSLIALLGATAYVLRPTRAYGPVLLVSGTVSIAYLLYLVPDAAVSISLPHQGAASFGYAAILLAIVLVILVRLFAAALVTVQDLKYPTERVSYEFPARVRN